LRRSAECERVFYVVFGMGVGACGRVRSISPLIGCGVVRPHDGRVHQPRYWRNHMHLHGFGHFATSTHLPFANASSPTIQQTDQPTNQTSRWSTRLRSVSRATWATLQCSADTRCTQRRRTRRPTLTRGSDRIAPPPPGTPPATPAAAAVVGSSSMLPWLKRCVVLAVVVVRRRWARRATLHTRASSIVRASLCDSRVCRTSMSEGVECVRAHTQAHTHASALARVGLRVRARLRVCACTVCMTL
jgi:hypothetical protein